MPSFFVGQKTERVRMSAPKHVKQVIKRLEAEIYHVHSVQKTFENLFVSSDKTRTLLLESDSAVFHDLYIVYLNYEIGRAHV